MDYLPKDATIEQACDWLHAKTGQTWVLPRLLECNLTPHFWLDYKPDYPIIFGNRIEGYQTRMVFHGDICRLEADGAVALVNMFVAHDGVLIKVEPPMRVPLAELRFKRAAIERVAEITNNQSAKLDAETPEKRRARWLAWLIEEEAVKKRGAVQRVFERELKKNPKADRSYIGKEMAKAKSEKSEAVRADAMYGQLVQAGTHHR